MEDQKNLEEAQELEAAENTTQVTSIAQEEEKTGQKIKVPSPEELVQRASMSLIRRMQRIDTMLSSKDPLKKLSNRGIKRALVAGLNLPTEGLPVSLKKKEEKELFALIQGAINDRFVIIQHHITQEIQRRKVKEQEEAKAETENEQTQKESTDE